MAIKNANIALIPFIMCFLRRVVNVLIGEKFARYVRESLMGPPILRFFTVREAVKVVIDYFSIYVKPITSEQYDFARSCPNYE